jgi:L-ascorbate metabolism protein UlaG (beta-lactamase superfamily)
MSPILLASLLAACGSKPAPPAAPEVAAPPPAAASALEAPTPSANQVVAGPFTITPVYHATTRIQLGDQVIWLDPWSKGALADGPKADLILITDLHQDHYDEAALAAVSDADTVVIAPKAVAEKREAEGKAVQHVIGNGEILTLGALTIAAVPMYNLQRGPEAGTKYHDAGRGNGYVLTSAGTSIYFAGDTECVPEIAALTGIDVAFLPMNLPYTMTPEEAGACVVAFKPKLAVPYHYAGSDLEVFRGAVGGVEVRVVEFYPGGAPW